MNQRDASPKRDQLTLLEQIGARVNFVLELQSKLKNAQIPAEIRVDAVTGTNECFVSYRKASPKFAEERFSVPDAPDVSYPLARLEWLLSRHRPEFHNELLLAAKKAIDETALLYGEIWHLICDLPSAGHYIRKTGSQLTPARVKVYNYRSSMVEVRDFLKVATAAVSWSTKEYEPPSSSSDDSSSED